MQRTAESSQKFDYDAIAVELVRALRGRRSCAELSRRAGYQSNIASRWEARECWPTAARFLAIHQSLRRSKSSWLERFFHGVPDWASELDPDSPEAVAAFLRHLKGKTPMLRIAALAGQNRFSVSRWLNGSAEPKLPEFLCMVDVTGRRLLDFVASLEDPSQLRSTRDAWARLQLARESAYGFPWSHAVLRVLEIEGCPRTRVAQLAWIAERLNITTGEAASALSILESTGQVHKTRAGLRPVAVTAVNTNADPVRDRELKLTWARTALARIEAGVAGTFGYSLFAVSHADLTKLRNLQLEYVRAMQATIADSKPSECVGLYCVQLLDLAAVPDK